MKQDNTPKIYLIWSGDVSKNIAKEFKGLSNIVFAPSLGVFMSETDIMAGELSVSTLLGELRSCEFGLAFIYKDNARAPWVNFEFGALSSSAKSLGVFALIIDNNEKCLAGTPVSDSQYKCLNKDGLWNILTIIIEKCSLSENRDIFKERFDRNYPEFQKKCDEIIKKQQNRKTVNDSPLTNEDGYGEILGQLVSINNILKLGYVDEIKAQIMELKKILLALSSNNIDAIQLSFKSEKYELAYKNYVEKTLELISKLTASVNAGEPIDISVIIALLEKNIEQIMNICME